MSGIFFSNVNAGSPITDLSLYLEFFNAALRQCLPLKVLENKKLDFIFNFYDCTVSSLER